MEVAYCSVCTLPHEYCEFGPSPDLCARNRDENTVQEEKQDDDNDNEDLQQTNQQVLIFKGKKSKRKYTTMVSGLEQVGVKVNKKLTKDLRGRFACGVTITTENNVKAVLIQGDVSYDLPDYLESQFDVPRDCMYFLDTKSGRKTPV